MKYRICISALLLWAGMQLSASNNQEEVVIKIIETSDVHGNFFPYNFIERKEWSGKQALSRKKMSEERRLRRNRDEGRRGKKKIKIKNKNKSI